MFRRTGFYYVFRWIWYQLENGETRYGHVCKDGPVFRAEEVELLTPDEQRERIASGIMIKKEEQA